MTKEQEQAIEIIDKMIKSYIEADECGLSNNDFKYEIRAMQTVLNLIQKQQSKIKRLECTLAENQARELNNSIYKSNKSKEDLEMLNAGWQIELEKKDKEIKELKENIDYQVLCDFLISSVCDEEEPIWTEKHIEELLDNFEVRWRNAHK